MAAFVRTTTTTFDAEGNASTSVSTELVFRDARGRTRIEKDGLVIIREPGVTPTVLDSRTGEVLSASQPSAELPSSGVRDLSQKVADPETQRRIDEVKEAIRKNPLPAPAPLQIQHVPLQRNESLGSKNLFGQRVEGRLMTAEVPPTPGISDEPYILTAEKWTTPEGLPVILETSGGPTNKIVRQEFFHMDLEVITPEFFEAPAQQ